MRATISITCAAVLGACASYALNPGVQITAAQSGVTEVASALQATLNALLGPGITIPDIHIDTHVAEPIGHITLDLTNIKITDFDIATATATLQPPAGAGGNLDLSLNLGMDYKWRKVNWPHASDHGEVTIEPHGAAVSLQMVSNVTAGKLALSVTSAQASFASFDIHFDGKVAWLYNLLVDLLKSTLKDAIAKAIEEAVTKAIDTTLDVALAKLPATLDVGGGKSATAFDTLFASAQVVSLPGPPPATVGVATLPLNSTDVLSGQACPYSSAPLPAPGVGGTTKMISVAFDTAPLQCAAWVSANNRAFDARYTNATAPAGFPLPLYAGGWASSVPGLVAKFPASTPMGVNLTLDGSPVFQSTQADGLVMVVGIGMAFEVESAAAAELALRGAAGSASLGAGGTPVFTLNASASVDLEITARNGSVVNGTATGPVVAMNVTKLSLQLGEQWSGVGPVNLGPLQLLVDVLAPLLEAGIDALLGPGIALPALGGISVVSPEMDYGDGYVLLSTDISIGSLV